MNMNIKIFNKIKAKQSILSKDQIEGKSVELLPMSRSHHGQDSANFRLVDLFERLKRSQEYCLHFKNTYPFLSVF
jgi:hypothetical protein